jgi:hypothetical protein
MAVREFHLYADMLKRAAKVVNSFDSEQVQLRALEALLAALGGKDRDLAAEDAEREAKRAEREAERADRAEALAGRAPEPAAAGQPPAAEAA